MKEYTQEIFTGERALFMADGADIKDCVFEDGESPLKESKNLTVSCSEFRWKYPLWYCHNVKVSDCKWSEMGRAGVWYSDNITVNDSIVEAPKNFRRCSNLIIRNTSLPNAAETLWHCDRVTLENVTAKGDYFAMNCSNMEIDGLNLDGNYPFDGAKNLVIRNSNLISKDAFWNTENVTVYNSFISGEYLGWNSRNITFIDCTIESLQGMCYCDNIVMKNCKTADTTLAFEYSTADVEIVSGIESVFNPTSGVIKAESIGELIIEPSKVEPDATAVECDNIYKKSDLPEWLKD